MSPLHYNMLQSPIPVIKLMPDSASGCIRTSCILFNALQMPQDKNRCHAVLSAIDRYFAALVMWQTTDDIRQHRATVRRYPGLYEAVVRLLYTEFAT